MNPFSEMINKYNLRFNHKINKFCVPIINNFGVNHFWYYKINQKGYYTCLGSNLAWTEFYYSEKLYLPNPFLRKPENFNSGIRFIGNSLNERYRKSLEIGVKNFNVNQSLLFLEKTIEGVEGYGFASCLTPQNFELICAQELLLLKFFIKKFREEFESLICKMSDDLVDIASLIGSEFYTNNHHLQNPFINRKDFLNHFQLSSILSLSQREKEVLSGVSKGLTSPQIGEQLRLSKRTVEHYIENIKNKLNCFSKAELIQKANEFLSIGYSLP